MPLILSADSPFSITIQFQRRPSMRNRGGVGFSINAFELRLMKLANGCDSAREIKRYVPFFRPTAPVKILTPIENIETKMMHLLPKMARCGTELAQAEVDNLILRHSARSEEHT